MVLFYLFMLSLLPVTMIGIGLAWSRKLSPKKINPIMGYRTPSSMKSIATWEFAHRYFGAIWLYTGLPLGLISLVLLAVYRDASEDALGNVAIIVTYVQLACMLLPIIPTEVELKKRFDEHGNPK